MLTRIEVDHLYAEDSIIVYTNFDEENGLNASFYSSTEFTDTESTEDKEEEFHIEDKSQKKFIVEVYTL